MKFKYTNYKGETEERNVRPIALCWQGSPGFGYQPGLFLQAYDLERDAVRTFSLGPDHFQPSEAPGILWDDGGGLEIYKFPDQEQTTLGEIQATVLKLSDRVMGLTIPTKKTYFYRHKDEPPVLRVVGPMDELPEAVRVNRDAFIIWETI